MTEQIFSTSQAAEYLNIPLSTFKYHLYYPRTIEPDIVIGRSLAFRKETLDKFHERRRKPGRPLTAE